MLTHLEELGDGREMTGEVALGPLRHTLSTPSNQNVLGQTRVGILDLEKAELDLALRELVNQIGQFTVCPGAQRSATS